MENGIIIAVLAVIVILAVRSSCKHFRGEGGCCGGSTYKARKKKLSKVTGKKIFQVEGMHCQHCVNRVMESVNDIPGASAMVNLKKGTVTVSMERLIDEAVIKAAIERGGYTVTAIR